MEDCRFEYHPIIDGNGVKTMPGLIPASNPGWFKNWKGIIEVTKYLEKNFVMCSTITSVNLDFCCVLYKNSQILQKIQKIQYK